MSKILLVLSISVVFGKIEVIEDSLEQIKKAVAEKPIMVWSTIAVCDLSTNPLAFSTTTVVKIVSLTAPFPNSFVIVKQNTQVFKNLDVLNLVQFVILDRLPDINYFISNIKIFPYQNLYRKIIFQIQYFDEEELKLLGNIFQNIWNHSIWNSNIHLFNNGTLYDYISNPFTGAVIRLKENKTFTNQFDKFANIHQYKIRVSMIVDERSKWLPKSFSGNYENVLMEIGKLMNATFLIKTDNSVQEAYENVKNGVTEFCFIGHFHGVRKGVKYAEPFKRDDVILLVPKAKRIPQFLNLVNIFTWKVWCLILGTWMFCGALIYLHEKENFSLIILNIFGITLGLPIQTRRTKFEISGKIVLATLLFYGMVVNSIYNSTMLAALMSNNYYDEIDTLEDLYETDLKICVVIEFGNMVPAKSKNRLIYVNIPQIKDMILKRNSDCAYAIIESHARAFLRDLTNLYGDSHFHIMKERFIPGFESFFFHTSSIFIYKINEILKRIDESGLFLYGGCCAKSKDFLEFTALDLSHLYVPFVILAIGCGMGILVFLGEILKEKWNLEI